MGASGDVRSRDAQPGSSASRAVAIDELERHDGTIGCGPIRSELGGGLGGT